jgi:GNAT superfamily N-acetyltransferase
MEIQFLDPDALDELEPLWSCMRERHGEIGPAWIGPTRERAESWARRRADYARWLDEDALVLVARDGGRAVGYAFATLDESDSSTWLLEGRTAELESLAVLPEARGAGVGAALLAAVREQLRALGVRRIDLTVVEGNDDAMRFYEREGFRPFLRVLSTRLES